MNDIEIRLSEITGKSRQMIKFYTIRMIEEIRLKRTLNRFEQQILYGRCGRGINRELRFYKKEG